MYIICTTALCSLFVRGRKRLMWIIYIYIYIYICTTAFPMICAHTHSSMCTDLLSGSRACDIRQRQISKINHAYFCAQPW